MAHIYICHNSASGSASRWPTFLNDRWDFWYFTCEEVRVFSGTDYQTKSGAVFVTASHVSLQGATGTTEPLNDHKMGGWRSSFEQTITERNHWVLNEVVTVYFIALLCANCSVLLFICQNLIGTFSTRSPPSGAETVSSLHAHEENDATYVTCCYYTWLTCLSICKYFKCETNVHFYQQRSCLINGLYPWRVYLW